MDLSLVLTSVVQGDTAKCNRVVTYQTEKHGIPVTGKKHFEAICGLRPVMRH